MIDKCLTTLFVHPKLWCKQYNHPESLNVCFCDLFIISFLIAGVTTVLTMATQLQTASAHIVSYARALDV